MVKNAYKTLLHINVYNTSTIKSKLSQVFSVTCLKSYTKLNLTFWALDLKLIDLYKRKTPENINMFYEVSSLSLATAALSASLANE